MPDAPRKNRLKIVLAGIIVLICGATAAVFVGYRQIMQQDGALIDAIKENVSIAIEGFDHIATRDGFTEWRLHAESAELLEGGHKALLDQISVTFFLKDGKTVAMRADKGVLMIASNDMEVSGDVLLNNENYQLETQRLNYSHKTRMLFSTLPVAIRGEEIEMEASAFYLEIETRNALFKGNVKGTIRGHELL